MRVNESFKAIQGEGPLAGIPVYFVRLSGCNLNCDFCDTKYHIKSNNQSPEDVVKYIIHSGLEDIVFTGGEPMLQFDELEEVMDYLPEHHFYLETNGTIYNRGMDRFGLISCSPKKQAVRDKKGIELMSYININNLHHSAFKFVYESKNDQWWLDFISKVGIPNYKVWMMPEGATREEQLKKMPEVTEYCLANKFNLSPRLHVLSYNTRRGV